MLVASALIIGAAVGGAAYWSWDVFVAVRTVQTDTCLNNLQIQRNAEGAHVPLVIPTRLKGC